MTDQAFIAIEDVCTRYALTRRQVLRLVEAGQFPPALRVGGIRARIVRFSAAAVADWEARSWQRDGDIAARAEAVTSAIRQPSALRRRRSAPGQAAPGARPTDRRRSRADR